METPREYYYTYYSYEEWGRGYFGSRTCKCLPKEDVKYLGSSKDKTFNPKYKIILKSDYLTREEAYVDEIILHNYYDVANNPHFANKAKQTSTGFCYVPSKENGNGVFKFTKEELIEYGAKGGKKANKICKERGTGLYSITKEQRIENSKKSYTSGLAKLTDEQRKENGKRGAQKAKEFGVGLYGRTEEFMSNHGKRMYEERKGIHCLTSEELAKYASISGKIVSSRKYMCLETGFIANAGNLARYQRARGIDTSKRVRLE